MCYGAIRDLVFAVCLSFDHYLLHSSHLGFPAMFEYPRINLLQCLLIPLPNMTCQIIMWLFVLNTSFIQVPMHIFPLQKIFSENNSFPFLMPPFFLPLSPKINKILKKKVKCL